MMRLAVLLLLLLLVVGVSWGLEWGSPDSIRAVKSSLRTGSFRALQEATEVLKELTDDRDWILVLRRDGVTVWKKKRASDGVEAAWLSPNNNNNNETHVAGFAVKATVAVDVAADALAALLLTRDYDQIRRFNPTIVDGRDLEWRGGRRERVTYVQTKPVWPLAPRDFVCRVQHVTLDHGVELIINEPETHKLEPPRRHYVRGRLRGLHHITPTSATSCLYTSVHEIDASGSVPRILVNHFALRKPLTYCRQLRDVAATLYGQRAADGDYGDSSFTPPPPSAR